MSGGKGTFFIRFGSCGFPTQLTPMWNVYGRGVRSAGSGLSPVGEDVLRKRARGALRAICLARDGLYILKAGERYRYGGTSMVERNEVAAAAGAGSCHCQRPSPPPRTT